MRAKDLTGKTFGYLTVIRRDVSSNGKSGNAKWLCRCKCGEERSVVGSKLVRGEHRSCGCKKGEHISKAVTTHGMTGTPTYNSWGAMINRCTNANHPRYRDYGGRGIVVCNRWRKFANFLEDMGERPNGLELERRDNNSGYSKENCYWATHSEQARNRRSSRIIETSLGTMTQAEAAEIVGVTQGAIQHRRKAGWSKEDILKPCTTCSTAGRVNDSL